MKLVVLLLLAGCGAPIAAHNDNEAATLGAWCDEICAGMCTAMADACFSGNNSFANGCRETCAPGCLASRSRDASSGRTWGEAKQCLAKLKALSCEGLGAGIGSGSLADCQAKAQ